MIVRLSGTLLKYTDYRKEIALEATTVGEAIAVLTQRFPELQKVLFARDGNLRATHKIFLNGEEVRASEAGRAVGPDDQIDVLTAVSGG